MKEREDTLKEKNGAAEVQAGVDTKEKKKKKDRKDKAKKHKKKSAEASLKKKHAALKQAKVSRSRKVAFVDPDICYGCGRCVKVCKVSAITLKERG